MGPIVSGLQRLLRAISKGDSMALKRFLIERDIPGIGNAPPKELGKAATLSNETLSKLGPQIQWIESFVAADKTFCVYLARDEAIIREHARLSGFPATKITEIVGTIDPTTEKHK
jgi:hypothetical protein